MEPVENDYGIYSFIGIPHTTTDWVLMEEQLLDEFKMSDLIVTEGMRFKTSFAGSFLRGIFKSLGYNVGKLKDNQASILAKGNKDIYSVDLESKSALSDCYIFAEYLSPSIGAAITLTALSLDLNALFVGLPLIPAFLNNMQRLGYERRVRSVVIDYRNLTAAAKTTLLSKKEFDVLGYRPYTTLIYGPSHKRMTEYLSDIDLMKSQLKSYKHHPFIRLFDPEVLVKIDLHKDTESISRMNLSEIYSL